MNVLEKIEIHRATIANIDELQKISRDTFFETFAHSTFQKKSKTSILHFILLSLKIL